MKPGKLSNKSLFEQNLPPIFPKNLDSKKKLLEENKELKTQIKQMKVQLEKIGWTDDEQESPNFLKKKKKKK